MIWEVQADARAESDRRPRPDSGCGSPQWGRTVRPPQHRPGKNRRSAWQHEQPIPARTAVDQSLLERLREAARRTIAEHRLQIEAMLAA
jgi:hypothetical protein